MKTLIAAAALLLATGAPSYAQTADITGKWDVNVNTAQGPMPSTMVLKKDGGKILGTLTGQLGEIPVEAAVKEKTVAIYGTVQTGSSSIDFALEGTVDGNTMKGSVSYGGGVQGDWAATRAADSPAPAASAPAASAPAPSSAAQDKIDVTGTWAFEVTTDMGTGNSTVVLKQDGEKLTGTYTGQYGEAALTGTVKGKDITFAYDLARDSASFHIVYTGTVDKDTMKGTLSIADMGTGSFTGKKTK
jgi:hypothetical protein